MAKKVKPAPARSSNRLLVPKALLGVIGVLAVGVVTLGVLLFLGVNGTTKHEQALTVVSCDGGTPGCELREEIHEHANFAFFTDGKKFDFNKPEFLSVEGQEKDASAHIHEPRYGVVHLHRSKTTWNQFFRSLGFDLTDPSFDTVTNEQTCLTLPNKEKLCGNATKKFHFIVNGVKVVGVNLTQIHDLDRVLIAYGTETDAQAMALYAQVDDDACIPSLRCPERIPPGEPTEQCTGKTGTKCTKPGG